MTARIDCDRLINERMWPQRSADPGRRGGAAPGTQILSSAGIDELHRGVAEQVVRRSNATVLLVPSRAGRAEAGSRG